MMTRYGTESAGGRRLITCGAPEGEFIVRSRWLGLVVFRGVIVYWFFFFFFQAEDGIRDGRVTGQTCALPIFEPSCISILSGSLKPKSNSFLLRKSSSFL